MTNALTILGYDDAADLAGACWNDNCDELADDDADARFGELTSEETSRLIDASYRW